MSLCLLFLAALAMRAAFVAFAAPRGNDLVFPDAAVYDSIARNWLAGKGFREDSGRQASRAPGYPVFLAACHSVGLQRPQGIYLIQGVADSAMCVLLAMLGRRLFGDAVGIVAGCIAAIYPFFIYFTGLLLAETLFTLGLVALMLFLVECADALEKSMSRTLLISAAAGVLLGLLVLLRSSLLLFPLFLLPIWLARRGHRLGRDGGMGNNDRRDGAGHAALDGAELPNLRAIHPDDPAGRRVALRSELALRRRRTGDGPH